MTKPLYRQEDTFRLISKIHLSAAEYVITNLTGLSEDDQQLLLKATRTAHHAHDLVCLVRQIQRQVATGVVVTREVIIKRREPDDWVVIAIDTDGVLSTHKTKDDAIDDCLLSINPILIIKRHID